MQNLDVIEETNDYIVVNKSAGLITEKSPFEKHTVENQVFNHVLETKRKPFIGVIHRLDRVTSGVLVFAKKKSVLVRFNTLFSSRKVRKTYLAIVKNKPEQNKGNLVNFLVKNNREKRADIVQSKSKKTLDCMLSYKVMDQNQYGYLLEVRPKTGRFHQIRAQLAHIGLPIIGDDKYGSNQNYFPLAVCLHAWKIAYKDSVTGEITSFEAPVPNNKYWKFKSI